MNSYEIDSNGQIVKEHNGFAIEGLFQSETPIDATKYLIINNQPVRITPKYYAEIISERVVRIKEWDSTRNFFDYNYGTWVETTSETVVGMAYDGTSFSEYVEPPKSPAEIKKMLIAAVQNHLDNKAAEKGYGDEKTSPIVSACSYAAVPNEFQTEAVIFLQWRSAVWAKCYQIMGEVEATPPTRDIPTVEELILELPQLVLV